VGDPRSRTPPPAADPGARPNPHSRTQDESGGRLFRLDGPEWVDITPQLDGILDEHPKGVYELVVHKHETNRVIVRGITNLYWVSSDGGATWARHELPENITNLGGYLHVHPFNPNVVGLMARHASCAEQWVAEERCPHDLLIHHDFGNDDTKWIDVQKESGNDEIFGFLDFEWGVLTMQNREDNDQYNDPTARVEDAVIEPNLSMNMRLLATAVVRPKGKGRDPIKHQEIHLLRSDDNFKSYATLLPCMAQFVIVDDDIIAAVPTECACADEIPDKHHEPGLAAKNLLLYVSEDEGNHFNEVCIPSLDMDKMFTVFELHGIDGGHMGNMLVADHDEEDGVLASAPLGNAYSTGYNANVFSHSRKGVFWESPIFGYRVIPDMEVVRGVPGVVLANSVPPEMLNTSVPADSGEFQKYVQTWRSTNAGAGWAPLSLTVDADGKPEREDVRLNHPECNGCGSDHEGCSLHLHFSSGWFFSDHPPLYSHASAPGLIMGTGNFGPYLDHSEDALCTFISRDAGLTWEDVRPRSHIYEYGDHGGVIVMGQHRSSGPTDHVELSLDFGRTWTEVKLEPAMDIENIRLEPGGRTDVFVIHGTTCKVGAREGCTGDADQKASTVVFTLDVSSTLKKGSWRECDADKDYEAWHVPRAWTNEEGCLMGSRYSFHRRKQDRCCQNTYDFQAEHRSEGSCACSHLDMACDFGSYMTLNTELEWPASFECQDDPLIPREWCPAITGGDYVVSDTRMRLVAGDICEGWDRIAPDTDGQGHTAGKGHRGSGPGGAIARVLGVFTLVVACTVLVGGAAFAFARAAPADAAARVGSAASAAGAMVMEALEKARGAVGLGGRSADYYTSGLDPIGDDFAGAYQPMPAGRTPSRPAWGLGSGAAASPGAGSFAPPAGPPSGFGGSGLGAPLGGPPTGAGSYVPPSPAGAGDEEGGMAPGQGEGLPLLDRNPTGGSG